MVCTGQRRPRLSPHIGEEGEGLRLSGLWSMFWRWETIGQALAAILCACHCSDAHCVGIGARVQRVCGACCCVCTTRESIQPWAS